MYDLFTKHFVAELCDFLFHDDYRIKLISVASEMESQLQCACAFSRLGLDNIPDETGLTPGQKSTAWVALQLGEIHELQIVSDQSFKRYLADVIVVGMSRWPHLWQRFYHKGSVEVKRNLRECVSEPQRILITILRLSAQRVEEWYDENIYH
jgi:ubiquinone biosynthesis protein UbiJ